MSGIDFSDPATIAFLTDALTAAGVSGLEISRPDGQLRIVIATGNEVRIDVSATSQPAPAAQPLVVVKAPMAGHFCTGSPLRSVSAADILGFLRVGPILLPLCAGRAGILTKQLAKPDALVGFGDPLFEIEPQS
ncbi:acetyl-CoA carboxylase biotin carboxyl carrier protein [Neorhizobium galegae]|uniref:acetyl-CoA carboxylase biotin carboxyl carrier protein n=1 Tax=Neorhizobium galegae TaxID=399 RepID=UPI0006226C3E|nr:acetyl-CoA carboxylase [Neorhizobium galegae]CDZ63798.1 Biotin carboxyl carrier protein [Neorhizobium galegae bv. orientalis]KAB1120399.1 acetyl-CoA carboxylase [Neorhizobium galegae]MCQ1569917.1 acetyl-CoA carboxylase [Neorhizobium galegae]MCQ1810823.1 acetyl-CoA carboxylase [Neorhizobium galegae]CDZ67252.1 Biotin carboxyl carrier protein [Neorhizobium galegae bv. orientalis]